MRRRKLWISMVILLLVVATITTGLLLNYRQNQLEGLRNEALEKLEREEGQYDDQSIVLVGTSRAKAKKLAKLYNAELRITEDGRFAALTLPEGTTIRDVYAMDVSRRYIEDMSADYHLELSDLTEAEEDGKRVPTRPLSSFSDTAYEKQTYLDYVNMGDVWNNRSGKGVKVAVIDSGIDYDHPEFAGRISEYSYNATEDKVVKDWLTEDGSYDWSLLEDNHVKPHGTAVAGVIAAARNGEGVVGIAPNVELIMIKVECDDNGQIKRASDAIFGLYYAIEQDAQVVNMSFGGAGSNMFAEVLQLAYDSDIVCVASAGNGSSAALHYPSADKNAIGVGALEKDSWEKADYSNYGENVDVVAPGTTYTVTLDGAYREYQGTSLSAPVVTGIIALYLQDSKYATVDKVREVLYASCYDIGDLGKDYIYGYGAVDASSFVQGQQGTVTFEMLTEEVENLEKVFIRGHALQELPEPERLYAIFDGWYYDDTFTQRVEYYQDAFHEDITLYAKWSNEDDGVPYTYVILDDGTVEIRSYTGHRRYMTIPDTIEGRTVSSIGVGAFRGQSRIREITLPNGLTTIKGYAFAECSNLIEMDIPAGVTYIGERAFQNDVRFSSLRFADDSKLNTVGDFAFSGCSSLESVELPVALQYINGTAFYATSALHTISVPLGSLYLSSRDGVLYNASGSNLIAYPAAHGAKYALPEITTNIGGYAFALAQIYEIELGSVETIGNNAFTDTYLRKLVLPDSVVQLGEEAFARTENLSQMTIGAGLKLIPNKAFIGSGVRELHIPQQVVQIGDSSFAKTPIQMLTFAEDSQLAWIGMSAFLNAEIQEVDIPASVSLIGSSAFAGTPLRRVGFAEDIQIRSILANTFSGCSFLESIELPKRIVSIGDMAFANSGLRQVTIPASIESVGPGAFAYCDNLIEVNVETGNKTYHSIDGVLYSIDNSTIHTYPAGKTDTAYTIHADARSVGPYAFAGTLYVKQVTLPYGMTYIGDFAFISCGADKYNFPSTLKVIGERAFKYNQNLTSLTLPDGLEEIAPFAFESCGLRTLKIPDNVRQIGRYAFKECWNLTTVTFNETSQLPRLGYGSFAYTGIVYFTVPANVSTMGQDVFLGCRNLRTVTFAKGSALTSLSAYMFRDCPSLYGVYFEEGSALSSLQAHSLEGLTTITSIDLSNTKLTNIDNFAFRFCNNLSSVILPETVTNVGRYAFYGCETLSELSLPMPLEHIGSYAFLGTNNLELYMAAEQMPLYLDENWDRGIKGYYTGVSDVITEGDWKYAILTSGNIAILEYSGSETELDLNVLDFGGDITILGGGIFKESAVTSVILPDTLVTIQSEAFQYTALQRITIPGGVTFIGREAFAHTDLREVIFEEDSSLSVIEQYAFEATEMLTQIMLPASLTKMGTGAFQESGLVSVTFAEGIALSEIPERAFAETKLTTVSLPDSVTLINHSAFNHVTTLKTVQFGENEGIRLMSNVFYQTGLEKLHIPANVTYIGEFCFVALTGLEAFTVDTENPHYTAVDGVLMSKDLSKVIAVPANKTGSYTVPATVETIGFGAFEESKLSQVLFHEDANILTFGYRSFFRMHNLTSITVPANVVSVDYYAFAYCDNLQQVVFAEGCKLKGIYEGAFLGCNSLQDITVPKAIVEISDFAFYGCGALTKMPVADAGELKGIYDYAFAYTGISGEMVFADTLNDIGNYAFLGTGLTKVVVPDSNAKVLMIGLGAFEDCIQLEEITLPFLGASYEDDQITWFGYIFGAGNSNANATYVPHSLKTVTVTEGITKVGYSCFRDLTMLETINLPESISVLYPYAFDGTTAIYELRSPVSTADGKTYNARKDHFGSGIMGTVELSDMVTTLSDAFYQCTNLNRVILPEGITQIGKNAFYGCTSLEEIILPESVTSIGGYAFQNCQKLKKVNIPSGVTEIAAYTFAGCSSLPGVTLPNGLVKIGMCAFENCTAMETLVIPENVTSLGSYAFENCVLLQEMTLPAGITVLNAELFRGCTGLQKVKILGNVTSMSATFYGCTFLTSITIPETVTTIGNNTFSGCTGLTEIKLPSSLTSIGANVFAGCTSLKSITMPNSVTSMGMGAFDGCTNLETVHLSENLQKISDYAFRNCSKLETVHIPNTVTEIGNSAFYDMSALRQITGAGGVETIKQAAFYNCRELESYPMSDCMVSLGQSAFSFCVKLDGLVLPETVTTISDCAFMSCYALSKINIPRGVTKIGQYAFDSTGLTEITIAEGVQEIGNYAFRTAPIVSLTLPDSITTLGNYAFQNCGTLKTLHIGSGLNSVGTSALSGLGSLADITVSADSTAFLSFGAGLYDNRSKSVILYARQYAGVVTIPSVIAQIADNMFSDYPNITEVVLHDGVTLIGRTALANCTSLRKLVVPDSVKSFQWNALSGCTALETLVIGNGVTTAVPEKAFEAHANLKTVSIGNGVTTIGKRAFYNCPNLTDVTIGNGVTAINDYTFNYCSMLKRVSIGTGVASLGAYAFDGCSSLSEIALGNPVTTLGNYVFRNCSRLRQLPDLTRVTTIPTSAFSGCNALTGIVIPDNVTSIGASAFYNCGKAETVVIGNGVTTIGANAFAVGLNLRSVTLGTKVQTIGEKAFEHCQKLFEVYNNSNIEMQPGVYANYGMLTSYAYVVVDKDGNATYKDKYTNIEYVATDDGFRFLKRSDGTYLLIAYIGEEETITLPRSIEGNTYTIYSFSGGVNVTIPDGVTIGDSAFLRNFELKNVVIADGVRKIGDSAFMHCTGLEFITIGEGVTSIGSSAFYGCSKLKELVIPDSVTAVGTQITRYCSSLETFAMGSGVKSFNPNLSISVVFDGCSKLKQIIVSEGNTLYKSHDGILYDNPVTKILYIPAAISGELTVLEGITMIGGTAERFKGSDITGITLPGSLTTIGSYAFGCENLTRITIHEGTIAIGEYAFSDCKALTEVNLPNSLRTIGAGAFQRCDSLERIVIPDSVEVIERDAFGSCKNLTDVTLSKNLKSLSGFSLCQSLETLVLPDGLITIGADAFEYCTVLKGLETPDSVTEIGPNAFYNCTALESMDLPENLEIIGASAFYKCASLTEMALPESLTTIGDSAFYNCIGLTEIVLPASVTTIGESAFAQCTELESVTVSNGLESIGAKAFYGCTKLTEIDLPNSVTSVGLNAFPGLTKVSFPADNIRFRFIDGILYDLSAMAIVYVSEELPETVTILEGITEIGDSTFANRTGVEKIVLPQSLKVIGASAFSGCSDLVTVSLIQSIEKIGNYAFRNCSSLASAVIPTNATLGEGIFDGCSGLMQVTLPENMTKVPNYMFRGCKSLRSIDLPDALTAIGQAAFRNCSDLQEFNIPENVTTISSEALRGCSGLEYLVIPDKVTRISDYTLEGAGIETLVIGAGVTNFATKNNVPAGLKEFVVSEQNTTYAAYDGVLYNKEMTTILYVPYGLDRHIEIAEGVTQINGEFYLRKKFTGVSLPKSLTYISASEFTYCEALEYVSVHEDNTFYASLDGILYTKDYTQFHTIPKKLSGEVTIAEGIVLIPAAAFKGKPLTGITFPDSVEEIGNEAFYECELLKNVLFGKKIARIENKAFYRCYEIEELDFPDSLTTIGNNAFQSCSKVQYMSFGSSSVSFGTDVFQYCYVDVLDIRDVAAWCGNSGISPMSAAAEIRINGEYAWDLVIPEGVTTINANAFSSFHTALQVTLPSTLKSIGSNAFGSCGRLTKVINHSGLALSKGSTNHGSVAKNAVQIIHANGTVVGAEDYQWIVTEDGLCFVRENGAYTLRYYWGGQTDITLPSSINNSVYSIVGLSGAVNVIIPEGITQLEFNHNYSLQSIVLPEGLTAIKAFSFNGCLNLRHVALPSTLKRIGQQAFADCSSLESIVIPEGMTHIETLAFEDCSKLVNITIPDSLRFVGEKAFIGTEAINNKTNGVAVVDGWIVDVDEDVKYIDVRGIRGAAVDAYDGCYMLRNAVWGGSGSLDDVSNVETLIITHLDGSHFPNKLTLKNVVLMDSVGLAELRSNSKAFANLKDVHIFVSKEEVDLRWNDNFPGWANDNPVYYGDEWTWVNFLLESGQPVLVEPRRSSQIIRLPMYQLEPTRDQVYWISGWDLDNDGVADSVPATAVVDICATAIIASADRYYTVRFVDGISGREYAVLNLPFGAMINVPQIPDKVGHTFTHWDGYIEEMTVSADVTIYAQWEHLGDGHSYGEPVWVDADCTQPGHYLYTCTICNESKATDITKPLGHQYVTTIMLPKCEEDGYTLHTCSRCKEFYVDHPVDATGHAYGNWITDVEASCLTEGTQHHTCKDCGATESKILEKTIHRYVPDHQTDSSCVEHGSITYRCQVCEGTISEDLPLKEHNYRRDYIDEHLQESLIQMFEYLLYGENGKPYILSCSECGHIMTADQAQNGLGVESIVCLHLVTHWEIGVEATCQTREVVVCICDECGEAVEGRMGNIEAHKLEYVDNTDGTHCYGCDTCDYVEIEKQTHTFIDGICVCGAVNGGMRGDLDLDGDVDAEDLTILARHVAGIELITGAALANADVNGDGDVDANDLTLHARYVAGIITDWEEEN